MTLEQVRSQEPVSPRELRGEVPHELEVICLKCLQKAPRDRYASAAALGEDLRRFLQGEPIRARPVGPLARAGRWFRRPERIRDASVVALALGLIELVGSSVGLFLVCTGVLSTPGLAGAVGYFLALIVGFGLPQLWVAQRAAARSVLALWGGLFLPPLFVAFEVLCFLGIVPSVAESAIAQSDAGPGPATQYAQGATLLILLVLQVVMFTAALLAYYANRSVPGFLPARHPGPAPS
jgi:hypothetical protein